MVVKRNRRQLYDELGWFFDTPPLPCDRPWRSLTTVNKGHGRLETRQLTCTDDLDDYLHWPGVQQVLRRACERVVLKTGEVTHAISYAVTSLPACAATVDELAALWRGHWSIENRRHYVRDVTLGEDACQMHTGQAPQALGGAAQRRDQPATPRRLAQHCGGIASLQCLGARCLTVHWCSTSGTLTDCSG